MRRRNHYFRKKKIEIKKKGEMYIKQDISQICIVSGHSTENMSRKLKLKMLRSKILSVCGKQQNVTYNFKNIKSMRLK